MPLPLWRRLAPLVVLAIIAGIIMSLGGHRFLTPIQLLTYQETLHDLVGTYPLVTALAFIGIYILVVATSLPGALILTLSGGLLFGIPLGATLSAVGATCGATALFLILTYAGTGRLTQRADGWLARLRDGFSRNAFFYLLFLRLVPVAPFFVVNIVAALLGMRLVPFALATLVGILPGNIIYTTIGAGFDEALSVTLMGGRILDVLAPHHLMAFAGLAVLSLIPPVIKTIQSRRSRTPNSVKKRDG